MSFFLNNKSFSDSSKNYSEDVINSFYCAEIIAERMNSDYLDTGHLLLGILQQKTSVGAKLLSDYGVDFERAKKCVQDANMYQTAGDKETKVKKEDRQFSDAVKFTLKVSWDIAQKELNHHVCGTEHIILSFLNQKDSRAVSILKYMDVDLDNFKNDIENVLVNKSSSSSSGGGSGRDSGMSGGVHFGEKGGLYKRLPAVKKSQSIVDYFGVDLTAKARSNKLDPVVGRVSQIQRVITILNRRTKNNPVLIGESGVGKTAVVEGLAQKIASEDVPISLLDKRIINLNLSSIIAGTKYRGEFEERLRRVIDKLKASEDTIIFIDEIHLLVGAGAAEGAMDASNILKPVLTSGELQVIGATTTSEYSKYIEKDAALERRFQPIVVPETTKPETLAILKGLKERYASYHHIRIPDEILEHTIALSARYINDRCMPDKAIDLLDEAAAHLRVTKVKYSPKELNLFKKKKYLEIKLENAARNQDYIAAAEYASEIRQLIGQLSDKKQTPADGKLPELEVKHLSKVISTWTGIPVQKIARSEAKSLLNLESKLKKRIIGQDEAIKAIAQAVRRGRSGVADPRRPIGSFIFLGPTGVGKTELAKVLAEEFYGRPQALIKIDMSEYGEKHTVSRLLGAPPGYVGFNQPSLLTDKIRRQPYSLILFDEIEKAHPDFFNLFLQILEDGQLTDSKDRLIDFTNTIIILTSNLGAEKLQRDGRIGFIAEAGDERQKNRALDKANQDKVLGELKKFLRPELINRLDKILVFKSLSKADVSKIVKIQLADLEERMTGQKLGLIVTKEVSQWLVDKGYDPKNGVRPLRRVIQEKCENAIAEALLQNKIQPGDVMRLELAPDKKSVEVVKVNE